jgi:uncharacterized membrane protein
VPPSASAGTSDTTTVQAGISGLVNPSTPHSNVTTAEAVSVDPAAPAVSGNQSKPYAGSTLVFTHQVTNTGDLSGNFEVVDLAFVGTPPSGWSLDSSLNPSQIDGDGSATLTITVQTPGSPPAGSVQFRFRVGVVAGEQTGLVTDTITIPTVRSFAFSAEPPTSQSSAAGGDVDFTYTLTNTGNAEDTFQVTTPSDTNPTSSISFTVDPETSFNLSAGVSRTITLNVQVPAGTLAQTYAFTPTASAVGGTGAPADQTATGTLEVTGGGAPQVIPGTPDPDPVNVASSSGTVVVTNTVRNIGNQAVPFLIGTPAVTGSPSGWSAALSGNACPTSPSPLAVDATCTFTVTVTVPQDFDAGPVEVRTLVTADNSGDDADASVTARNTVTVATVRGLSFVPTPLSDTGNPGAVFTFTHTLTNTGNATDSFDLDFTNSNNDFSVVLSPTSILNLPRDQDRTVLVEVTYPLGVVGGTNTEVVVTAESQGDSGVTAAVTDTATIASIDGAAISPGVDVRADQGQVVTLTHTLTNTGSTAIAFDVVAEGSQVSWSAPDPITQTTAVLQPGISTTVQIEITVPNDAPPAAFNQVTVEVFKASTSTPLLATATNFVRTGPAFGVLITPDRQADAAPNTTAVFTHTITNIGASQSLFALSVAESNGWPTEVSPDLVNLGSGESRTINVRVLIPSGLRAGDPGFVRVSAVSLSDDGVEGSATIDLTVSQVAGVDLAASQIRAVTPESGNLRLNNLVLRNQGSAVDTFDLEVEGLSGDWDVQLSPSSYALDKGDLLRGVRVTVTVPADVSPGELRTFRVVARSRFDGTATDNVVLTLVYVKDVRPIERKQYLPLVRR